MAYVSGYKENITNSILNRPLLPWYKQLLDLKVKSNLKINEKNLWVERLVMLLWLLTMIHF